MCCHGSLHLVKVVLEVVPCGRDVLLARVSPRVRVMEVYHYTLAEILGTPCLCKQILLVAPSVGRIYPYTKTYRVDTEVAQQRHAVLLRTFGIVELLA